MWGDHTIYGSKHFSTSVVMRKQGKEGREGNESLSSALSFLIGRLGCQLCGLVVRFVIVVFDWLSQLSVCPAQPSDWQVNVVLLILRKSKSEVFTH